MKIEIQLDSTCKEPKVIILTDKLGEEVNAIFRKLSDEGPKLLLGFTAEDAVPMDEDQIVRIYAQNGKVFCVTQQGVYTLRQRLYELEEQLDPSRFVRISNSEIVNLRKIRRFDLSLVGTICVSLANGESTYVSRRYVSKIKQILNL